MKKIVQAISIVILVPIIVVFLKLNFFKASETENVINTVSSYENSIKNKDFKKFSQLSYFNKSQNSFNELVSEGYDLDINDSSVKYLDKKPINNMNLYFFNNESKKRIYGILISNVDNSLKIVNSYNQGYGGEITNVINEIENIAKRDIELYNKNISKFDNIGKSSFDIEGSVTFKYLSGYTINAKINGIDLGLEYETKNEIFGFPLMNKDHSLADFYGDLYLSKYGSLKEGKNTIEIDYKKTNNGNPGNISIQLVNSACPFDDLINIDLGNSGEGNIKADFDITKSMIEKCDFKTINIKK